MTKITRTSLLLAFGVGFGALATPRFSLSAEPLSVSIALPVPALDLSDLDARDALNRPIRTSVVRQSFEQLWVRNLNQAVLNALTPTRLRLYALLNSSWDGFVGCLKKRAVNAFHRVVAWFETAKKQTTVQWQTYARQITTAPSQCTFRESGNSFVFLIGFVLSSTHLLR